jgi:uncharacterized membrane protein
MEDKAMDKHEEARMMQALDAQGIPHPGETAEDERDERWQRFIEAETKIVVFWAFVWLGVALFGLWLLK